MDSKERVTLLTTQRNKRAAKRWQADGTIEGYDAGTYFAQRHVEIATIQEVAQLFESTANDPRTFLIRGDFRPEHELAPLRQAELSKLDAAGRTHTADTLRKHQQFYCRRNEWVIDTPKRLLCIEVDGFETQHTPAHENPEEAIAEFIEAKLPAAFQEVSFYWQLSNSSGHTTKGGKLYVHLWFMAEHPATTKAWKRYFETHIGGAAPSALIDTSVYQIVQPHYVANPVMADGATDPCSQRSGFVEWWQDTVELNSAELPEQTHSASTAPAPQDALDYREAVAGIVSGEAYHGNLLRIAARLIGQGVNAGSVTELLEALMESSQTHDARWTSRFNEIPKIVSSAQAKYAAREFDDASDWADPTEITATLRPVKPFDPELLPADLREFVTDIAERQCTPIDYAAVTAIVSAGAVIGRKVRVCPKQYDHWQVAPNLWGMLVGRPSAGKSPAMTEALRPLKRLVAKAIDKHQADLKAWAVEKSVATMAASASESKAKTLMKQGDEEGARRALGGAADVPDPPTVKRYLVNDVTTEKLGELLVENPNGLLLERDELYGFLKSLERDDRGADRALYLEAHDGLKSYTYDRIARGSVHIPALCVSILGGIQPARLSDYFGQALKAGAGDDGFIQRFQLSVYPDPVPHKRVDRTPNKRAIDAVEECLKALDELAVGDWEHPCSQVERGTGEQYRLLRFTEAAQRLYNDWYDANEARIRSEDIHPAIESHLGKFRAMIPSIALILQLLEAPDSAAICEANTERAIRWSEYLFSHTERIYSLGLETTPAAAATVLRKLRSKNLSNPFKYRDVARQRWGGLADKEAINNALAMLEDYGWVAAEVTRPERGRPSTLYHAHPKLFS